MLGSQVACAQLRRSQITALTLLLLVAALFTQSAFAAAPVISGTPPTTVVIGNWYSFRPTASDADRNRLYFSISNKPSWAYFSRSSGLLTGVPRRTGTYSNIVIRVSDGLIVGTLCSRQAPGGDGVSRFAFAAPIEAVHRWLDTVARKPEREPGEFYLLGIGR